VVAEWQRNEREVIRITLSKYDGQISIDVWVWFRVEGREFRPSRRGISMRLTEISDIRKGLRKAREMAVGLGFAEQKTICSSKLKKSDETHRPTYILRS
jgi:hypothetical protein